ncbi:DnaB-like helicase N-terminal domain-containing protein [Pelotomaculum propionicicum]|uniref:Replicative DNA helicase n=1 Tax=Pelotomaculum propionicicum TaxID=258475 RepID=A0A4Y7RP89_9FIRM|nr:DnaB-like helicase N-terminal domain-containing protein [Pelotomaculum propionicicum]TEB10651.1 Replicative DNA helicase [Pelotomaculum propionicicum]
MSDRFSLFHNNDAEQSVLGGILLDSESASLVMEYLHQEEFFKKKHRIVFEAIHQMNKKDIPIDILTVSEYLRQQGKLEDVGGVAYIACLAEVVPTGKNVNHYAFIVKKKALMRSLAELIYYGHKAEIS